MNPVSPKLVHAIWLANLPFWGLLFVAGAALAFALSPWWWVLAACGAGVALLEIAVAPRRARFTGWLETEDDLIITKGWMWHTVTIVPYGRIQYVDVSAGPIARRFGLKELTINTASSTSDCTIPGLDAATADALRDRLAERARERMSGL